MRYEARLTKDGRVTIPLKMRDDFGLKPGEIATFETRDGKVFLIIDRREFLLTKVEDR